MSATNYGVAPGREAGIGSPIGPGRVGVNSAPASRGSASRSELDTLAFDPGPLSGPGYAMTGAQLTSASTSPHAATYDAPPLDGRTGAGSRSVQTAPERGIEIGNRELDALGRVQAAENPRHSGTGAEAWTALNRVASPATWWGRDIEGVVNAPSQFTPVLDAPGRSVWGLPRSPEAEQSLREALNAPNPVPGMTHFANPNALGNRAGASTRAWVSAADANPDNPRVGGHVFANVDRTSVPNFTPVVTAGLNQFTPTTPIPPTRAQMAGTAQPASAPQTAQVNIDKYINPDPLTYAQVVERDPSQIDFESIFAQNPSARPSTNTDPSPPVRTASAGAGGLFGISPAAAAPAPPPSTQAFAGPRAADLMEPGMPETASAQPRSPDPSIAPQNLGPGLTIPNAPRVAQSAPSQNVAPPSSQVPQSWQNNVARPNAQGGVDFDLDAAEPEGRTTAQKAAGYAGQGVGSMMGGVIGTGIAGPMGGLAGGLLGGWLGGKMGDGQPNQTPWTDSDSASYGSGGESPQPESAPDAVASSPAENVKRLEEKYLGLPMWREPGAGNGRPTPRQRFVENRSNYGRSL